MSARGGGYGGGRGDARPVLHVDWTRCEGRGVCLDLLEGRLVSDEDGFPMALGVPASARTDIPLDLVELPAAREAAALCPRLALRLEERTG